MAHLVGRGPWKRRKLPSVAKTRGSQTSYPSSLPLMLICGRFIHQRAIISLRSTASHRWIRCSSLRGAANRRSVRILEPGHAEIKRMFVNGHARGFGLGRRLLVALEDAARRQGITRLSLETGIRI